MAGSSNRFLYSKHNRVIFLKQQLFNTRFSVCKLSMYLLHEVLLPLKDSGHKCTEREVRSFQQCTDADAYLYFFLCK